MTWVALRIAATEGRDAIVAALFAHGAQAVVDEGTAVLTHFPAARDLSAIRAAVLAAAPGASISESDVADSDWSLAWRSRVSAHRAGTLTVAPPWLAGALDLARTIVIDPGMAFGTGQHESTRGVLILLQEVLRPGDDVADLGSGSAVLAIAAAKLGARRVYAIENDPDAIRNAELNVAANAVSGSVHVLHGEANVLLSLCAPVDLVLANIVSSVLLDLLPVIEVSQPHGGRAILSGLLRDERGEWHSLLAAQGWSIIQEASEGDWWSVAIRKS